MKHLKTRLTILLCVLSIMLLCFGLVACGTKTYKVTLDYNAEQGTVTLSPEAENNEYEEGTELTVTVTPNSDYELDTLTLSTEDRAATPNNEGKFVFKVQEDTTVRVTFKAKTPPPATDKFTLTVPASVANGTIEVSPESADGKYEKNAEITVTLKPAQGYEVDTFTVGGADKKADLQNNVYKFNITADTAINATFKATTPQPADKFTLTVPASVANGTIEVSPESADGKYEKNAEITVTLKPAQGYEVATFTVGGEDKKANLENNVYKFNITADTAITVSFSKIVEKFTLTVPASVDNGTVAVSPESADNKYDEGTEITVTLTPEQGYEVDTFTVGGEDKKADLQNNVYKFNITADTAVNATFKAKQFTVTTNCESAQGSITLSPEPTEGKYAYGTQVSVTVAATADYELDTFTVSTDKDARLDGEGKYTLTVSADTTISATFKVRKYSVKKNTPENGSIEVSPESADGKYEKNAEITVTLKPAANYVVETFTVGGVDKKADLQDNVYKFNITADTEINATFKLHDHLMDTEKGLQKGDTTHWYVCKVCGEKMEETNHSAKDATYYQDEENNKHYQLCVCGARVNESEHTAKDDQWLHDDGDGETGKHYQLCVCGEKVNEDAHDIDPEAYTDGATGHHFECAVCDFKTAVAAHEPNSDGVVSKGTTQHSYRCDDCNEEVVEAHDMSRFDFTKETFEYNYCTKCEYYVTFQHEMHTVSDSNGTHHSECQNSLWHCTYKSEPVACDMQWSRLENEEEGHKGNCPTCGYTVDSEEHDNSGPDGACSKCRYKKTEEHVCKDEPVNGFYDGVCDTCGKNFNNTWTFDVTTGTINNYSGSYAKVLVPVKIDGTSVTALAMNSFAQKSVLTDVFIPNDSEITTLNINTFGGSANLQSIVILSQHITSLPMAVAGNCQALSYIVLSETITSIGANAFLMCTKLGTVYFMGDSAKWDTVSNSDTTIQAVSVLYYKEQEGGDTEWHWDVDKVTPKPWKEV